MEILKTFAKFRLKPTRQTTAKFAGRFVVVRLQQEREKRRRRFRFGQKATLMEMQKLITSIRKHLNTGHESLSRTNLFNVTLGQGKERWNQAT